jgi:hypothetical protein
MIAAVIGAVPLDGARARHPFSPLSCSNASIHVRLHDFREYTEERVADVLLQRMSPLLAPSRHFAAIQLFGCFLSEADIDSVS